jgi:hypothetical protein
MNPCFKNKFHPIEPPCKNEGLYRSALIVGNATDNWTWCEQHKPNLPVVIDTWSTTSPAEKKQT